MFKSLGLGICCLALSISGVTRASVVPVDNGKYGNAKCFTIDKVCDDKGLDFKCDLGDKDNCKFDDKGCDLKLTLDCHDGKGDKDTCKLTWNDKHDHQICDISDKDCKDHGHDCDLVTDHCGFDPCGGHSCPPPCDPAAVPAPASAGFGGLGVIGMMIICRIRARRSAAV